MTDLRVVRLARLIAEYCVAIRRGDRVYLQAGPEAYPLAAALVEETILRGGMPHISGGSPNHLDLVPGATEFLLKHGSDEQLDYINPIEELVTSQFDVRIAVRAASNTQSLSGVDPERLRRYQAAHRALSETFMRRQAAGELRWCVTQFPTDAYAQEAAMSLREYEDFVYAAVRVDDPDPIARWRETEASQQKLVDWLAGKRRIHITGPNCDLEVGIEGRTFENSDGHHNMPSGEIFTGPQESVTEGWIKFTYPAIYQQRAAHDVRLEFAGGKVARATASRGEDFLLSVLDTDEGSRTLGEFAFGMNYGITRFTGNILFDEKLGGTIHVALGAAYPNTGGKNRSGVHWDMICDTRDGTEVTVDGEPFYRNGEFLAR